MPATDPEREPVTPAEQPANAAADSLPPAQIRPNPLNPRMFFDDASIEALATSIEDIGVLVPLTVYRDPSPDDGTTHVLLDGERRWKAAMRINYPAVPVWVIPRPSGVDNVLRMFNIHMLRREWDEIATAWALRNLMDQLGTQDVGEIARHTGLSRDRIRNIVSVLSFPKHIQDLVADGDLKFQYLVELEKNVLAKARQHADVVPTFDEAHLRDAFIQKYRDGNAETVELRKVGKLFNTARADGAVGSRARTALTELVQDPGMTIDEAYEAGAAASIELRRVLRDLGDLPERVRALLGTALQPAQRAQLVDVLGATSTALGRVVSDARTEDGVADGDRDTVPG